MVNKLDAGSGSAGQGNSHGTGGQYQIVEMAKPKGTVLGQPQDNFVMIPLLNVSFRVAAEGRFAVTMFVQARGPEWMSAAAEDETRVI